MDWAPIPGSPGYEAHPSGQIRSHRTPHNHPYRGPRVLKPKPIPDRYLQVNPGGRERLVHRLILLTFVGEPPAGHEACHLNGVRTDNRLVNLAWKTHRENIADKWEHGTMGTSRRILTPEAITEIRSGSHSVRQMAAKYGVSISAVYKVRQGKNTKSIDPASSKGFPVRTIA